MDSKVKFANKLRFLRYHSGLSQIEMGKELGLTGPAVAMMETSKRAPSFETLCAIADYFDVPTDFLTGRGVFSNWEEYEPQLEAIQKALSEHFGVPESLSVYDCIKVIGVTFSRIRLDGNRLALYPLLHPEDVKAIWANAIASVKGESHSE